MHQNEYLWSKELKKYGHQILSPLCGFASLNSWLPFKCQPNHLFLKLVKKKNPIVDKYHTEVRHGELSNRKIVVQQVMGLYGD